MRIRAFVRAIALTLTIAMLSLVLSTCGGGGKRAVNPPSIGSGGQSQERVAPPIQAVIDISLDDALAELDAYPCPEGVDAELFAKLKAALGEALQETRSGELQFATPLEVSRPGGRESVRIASTPPTSDENRVTDLELTDNGDETYTLSWHYRNLGDYDQSGTVGISDITPIAMHYGEDAAPENEWIDGDGSGTIGISDITPLAVNFGFEVASYGIEGSNVVEEPFTHVDSVSFSEATGTGWKEFACLLDPAEYEYYQVVPNDGLGESGTPSYAVGIHGGEAPVVTSVLPTTGATESDVTFTAQVSGNPPFTYAWNFGGGATPNSSTEESPTVTLSEPGSYSASVTVSSAFGDDVYPFTLTVTAEGPIITGLEATPGTSGVYLTWDPNLDLSVYLYQVCRDDLDDEAPPILLQGIFAPQVEYLDGEGIPGKEYQYSVRARDDSGYGAMSFVNAARELEAPTVTATYGFYEEHVVVRWTEIEGAVGYLLYRAPSEADTPQLINTLPAETTSYEDTEPELGETVWYWTRAQGEDIPGLLSDPERGRRTVQGRGDWWMFGREPTHNGRSPYVGAQTPSLKWWISGSHPWRCNNMVIAADGTVYGAKKGSLLALNTDGTIKWEYDTGATVFSYASPSSPAIGVDGTVYVGASNEPMDDHHLYAVNHDGTLRWRYETGDIMYSSPAIGAEGTVYVGSYDGYLYAITDNETEGTLKWRYETGSEMCSSPAIGADGTVYVGSGDYLYAINPEGTLKWRYETGDDIHSSPAIGADGTIYVGSDDRYLWAITDNVTIGTLKWRYETGSGVKSSPAIGADGTIYIRSDDGYLCAIADNETEGTLKWRYETGGGASSLAIGAEGTVYVGSDDNYLYAINPEGTLKWRYETGSHVKTSRPAIGADGTVYVGSGSYLYAFGD